MEITPKHKGARMLPLYVVVALVAAALLIAPYIGTSPVGTAVGQEEAPAAPADQPPAQPDRPAAPSERAEVGNGHSLSLKLSLRSVRTLRYNLNDDEEEFVEYEFNDDIQQILDQDGFMLLGPNSDDEATSDSAVFIKTDRRAVLVGFKAGTDLRAFTLAGVKSGTVRSRDGKVNLQHTIDLSGSTGLQGSTAAPDLLFVQVGRSNERVHYVFDESLNEDATPDPKLFGYYTRGGRMHLGDRIISVEDRVVTVEFRANVEDSVRWFVLAGAVQDLQGNDSTPRAVGSRTTKPDLSSVRRIHDTMFDYTFDTSVTDIKANEYTVWTARGAKYEGSAYARPDADTVRIIFPQLRYIGDQIVLAAVGAEAAKSAESITSQNTVGAMRISPMGRNNGGTAGPDLTSADVDERTGLVSFTFDESLDRRLTLDKIDQRNFFIVSSSGDLQEGIAVGAIGTNWVSILFNKDDVADASAVAIRANAVQDDEGNRNPFGSTLR